MPLSHYFESADPLRALGNAVDREKIATGFSQASLGEAMRSNGINVSDETLAMLMKGARVDESALETDDPAADGGMA